eukprot:g4112.t1
MASIAGMMKNKSELDLKNMRESALERFYKTDELVKKLGMSDEDADDFRRLIERYAMWQAIEWSKVSPPEAKLTLPYGDIAKVPENRELMRTILNKLAVVKLNGGLGTSMGCKGPKSCIEIHDDKTFLDYSVRQIEAANLIYGVDIPLLLMNSFNTHEATENYMLRYHDRNVRTISFTQNCFPRIFKDNMKLVPDCPFSSETKGGWYPPGHGDVYHALYKSRLLEQLVLEGKEYIFISNIDNLGATLQGDLPGQDALRVLYHMMENDIEFCIEVTDKTRGDIRGGNLVQYDQKTRVVEMSEVPPKYSDKFMSLKSFPLFNTNNLWVNIRALQRRLAGPNGLDVDVIVNTTELSDGVKVLQVESTAGAAVQNFERPLLLHVPRSRFVPVKTTSDLLAVQSNLYQVRHGQLYVNSERELKGIPKITLGPKFRTLANYSERFQNGIPDVTELEHFVVTGNVYFGSNIKMCGSVIIVADEGSRIDIPSGAVLDNVVITGNLRIQSM